jgi:hypothetical protein
MFIKWSSLQKRMSKFTPKKFYDIESSLVLDLRVRIVNTLLPKKLATGKRSSLFHLMSVTMKKVL